MADSTSSTRSSKKQKREENSDDIAMEMKHNKTRAPDNRLHVDQSKPTDMEQLVISANVAAPNRSYLPPDIVEEILDLLPFKSIERFRSVSKSLFSLLAVKFNIPRLLYYPNVKEFSLLNYSFKPFDDQGEPPHHPDLTRFSPLNYGIKSSDDRSLFTAVVLSDYSGDAKNRGYMAPELAGPLRFYCFVGSCNGLLCLNVSNHCGAKWETIVWNPFTGICRKLPHKNHYAYGFGYGSASDDYKVFAATPPHRDPQCAKVEIFSLKTGAWKTLENRDWEYLQQIQWYGGMGLFLNGALHWRTWESSWGEKGEIIAIAFDLGKEKFHNVPGPPNQISRGQGTSSLGVVGEYLCVCFSQWDKGQTNSIWVMKEYCNEASWVPFISYTSSSGYDMVDNCLIYVLLIQRLTYVCDFIPRAFKDGRYMMLQFAQGEIHVLKWNSNLDESDHEAKKYSKKIKFYRVLGDAAQPYTQTLTSPYAS
ncbi:hypothetical protein Tsubulata_043607 [Turnera subulata]|uniref:F-box domain-containing protein n=1 Tax=Turnera subulata TaxID=218843 RepID=A0A9Q0JCZ1_9ROSI|nr:hypothetical protein Tsubulata_043607 [Turnera subulata]